MRCQQNPSGFRCRQGRSVLDVRERELRTISLFVDRCCERIALAGAQPLEVDGVDDGDLVLGLHDLAALDRGGSGLEARGDLDRLTSSVGSSWDPMSVPSTNSFSNTTALAPPSSLASNVKVTSWVPSWDCGLNLTVAVISLPSAPFSASPVSASMSVPMSSYSVPGTRPVYLTVSTIVALPSAVISLSPSSPSAADVPISGGTTSTVCPSSVRSSWLAMTLPLPLVSRTPRVSCSKG